MLRNYCNRLAFERRLSFPLFCLSLHWRREQRPKPLRSVCSMEWWAIKYEHNFRFLFRVRYCRRRFSYKFAPSEAVAQSRIELIPLTGRILVCFNGARECKMELAFSTLQLRRTGGQ